MLASLLRIMLVFPRVLWRTVFIHSSWYSLVLSLKLLINYQEPLNSAVTFPRQKLSSCLKCQSGWRSGTLHVSDILGCGGPSAWGCFSGKRVNFNKQDDASPPAGLLLLLFSILQRQSLPYAHLPLPQHRIRWVNKWILGADQWNLKRRLALGTVIR